MSNLKKRLLLISALAFLLLLAVALFWHMAEMPRPRPHLSTYIKLIIFVVVGLFFLVVFGPAKAQH